MNENLKGKRYQIIYIDPPWDYFFITRSNYEKVRKSTAGLCFNKGNKDTQKEKKYTPCKSADAHYKFLSNDDLKALPINQLADDNCIVFLWITGPKLDIGIEVLTAWKFKYKTIGFVWYKQCLMPGNYTMSSCELVLIGTKGSIPKPRGARNIHQFLSSPRGKHSAKPHEIRNRINLMFPTQNKIEIFARIDKDDFVIQDQFKGWDAIGDGVDGQDIRDSLKEIIG
jgi:N6-adenosine-specific RNA methylase IME4